MNREAEGSCDRSPAQVTVARAEGQADTKSRGPPPGRSYAEILSDLSELDAGTDSASLLLAGTSAELSHVAQLLSPQFTINTVVDPQALLEAARATAPDLVIADSNLAERDGSIVLREMRDDPTLRGIPIILLSRMCSDPRTAEIGTIADDDLRWPFSDHELLARIALHLRIVRLRREAVAAISLREARLESGARSLDRLHEASSRLWRIESLREGLEEMLSVTLELVGADMGLVQLLDGRDGELVLAAHNGFEPGIDELLRGISVHNDSACGRSLDSAQRTVIEDVEVDPLYAPFRPVARAAGYRSVLAAPLIGRDGAPLGVLSTQFRSVHRPDEQDLRRLDLYARQAADFIERFRHDEALRESERRFRATFENAAVGIAHVAPNGAMLRVNDRLCQIVGWSAEELTTKTFPGITHPDDVEANLALLRRVLSGEIDHYAMEKRYRRKDGSVVWCNLTVSCVRKNDGTVDYFISVVEDISKRKRAEKQNRLLLREVNHRAKNLLAVVQAVARQTAGDNDPKVFAERFAARLFGLAACQDLLVRSDWRGVNTGELVRSQLAHFVGLIGTRILLDGPSLRLSPAAAQTIGMALHEFATNAGKHGSLSDTQGIVEVTWNLVGNDEATEFAMCWHERNGPPVAPPERRGFGHTVVVRMVEHALDAAVSLEHDPGGLVWRMSAPAQSVLDPPSKLNTSEDGSVGGT